MIFIFIKYYKIMIKFEINPTPKFYIVIIANKN